MRRIKILTTVMLVFHLTSSAQSNLLRNASFENGTPTRPKLTGQFKDVSHWNTFEDRDTKDDDGTTDWFRAHPNFIRGGITCSAGAAQFNTPSLSSNGSTPTVPVNDGDHFAGFLRENPATQGKGEGIQQRLRQKMDPGAYELELDFLIPCDTFQYALELYFGRSKGELLFKAGEIDLPSTPVATWMSATIPFTIPASLADELDWFILLNDGTPDPTPNTNPTGAYIYLDDLHLTPSACSTCEPTQQISWNENVPNFFSPDGDGVADTLTIENVNNINSYRIDVYHRWGGRVWFKQGFDLDGFENLMIRWDGTRRPGGQALASDTYYMTMQLDNCNSRVTRQYTIALCRNATCNLGAHVQVPNYVPPLFGLVVPPTWYQNLDVYGGPYYGQHHWYACHRITVGDAGSQITPYFWAANGSELKFSATFDIDIPTGHRVDFDTLADVEFIIEPVACCPSLRQAAPDSLAASDSLPAEPVLDKRGDGLAELPEVPCPNSPSLPARLHVYPNPSQGDWQLDYQLGTASEGLLRLYSAEGRLLGKWRLKDPAGQFRSDLPGLAKGLYVLRLDAGATRLSTRLVVE